MRFAPSDSRRHGYLPSETRREYVRVGSEKTWPRPASRPVPGLTSSLFFTVSEGRYPYPRLAWGILMPRAISARSAYSPRQSFDRFPVAQASFSTDSRSPPSSNTKLPPSKNLLNPAGIWGTSPCDRGLPGAGPERTRMYSQRVAGGSTPCRRDRMVPAS